MREPSQERPRLGATSRLKITTDLRGLLWMAFASALFAIMSIAARLASRSASWTMVGAARALLGAAVALAFGLGAKKSLRTRRHGLAFARSAFGTCAALLTFFALAQNSMPVGDAVTLFSTAPLFIAIAAPFALKERSDSRLWLMLVVAFLGVVLIAGPHLLFGSGGDQPEVSAVPALAALGAAVFSAAAMMFLRRMRTGSVGVAPESSEAIALHFAVTASAVHLFACLFSFQVPSPIDAGFLVLTGLSGGCAQLAMTRAYALAPAARLGTMSYLGTVLGFVGAVVFLGERPSWSQIAGAALVIGAGTALALQAARGQATAH